MASRPRGWNTGKAFSLTSDACFALASIALDGKIRKSIPSGAFSPTLFFSLWHSVQAVGRHVEPPAAVIWSGVICLTFSMVLYRACGVVCGCGWWICSPIVENSDFYCCLLNCSDLTLVGRPPAALLGLTFISALLVPVLSEPHSGRWEKGSVEGESALIYLVKYILNGDGEGTFRSSPTAAEYHRSCTSPNKEMPLVFCA